MSSQAAAIAPSELLEAARISKAWPFEEARKIVSRLEREGGAARPNLSVSSVAPLCAP